MRQGPIAVALMLLPCCAAPTMRTDGGVQSEGVPEMEPLDESAEGSRRERWLEGSGRDGSLEALMDTLVAAGFSGAAYVELEGASLLDGGFGGGTGPGEAITDSTLFYLASLSKQFTGAAALAASEAGCLDIDGTVARHVPRAGPEIGRLPIESLLAHTSGLPEYHANADERIDREEALRRILEATPAPSMGTYAYSNSAYTLLAAIIEGSCAVAFGAFLRERLFDPAGLEDTYVLGESAPRGLIGARGYVDGFDRGVPAYWTGPAWAHLGSGGVVSTLRDLERWARELGECTVLPEDACRRWVRPLAETRAGWYAYGWRVSDTEYGGRVIFHFGSESNGHSAALLWFPERRCMVIVLSNVQIDESGLASPTAVSLARRVLDPSYRGQPAYASPR